MTIQLEVLDDPVEPGFYIVEVCEYPAANADRRAYQLFRLDDKAQWHEQRHPARKEMIVYGWHGPLVLADMESLDDPTQVGYYAVWLQPWPGQSPHFKEMRVCIWRRGAWYDQYGWAKQYGNVLGWVGPFPMLRAELPWLRMHEKEEAEDIGLS